MFVMKAVLEGYWASPRDLPEYAQQHVFQHNMDLLLIPLYLAVSARPVKLSQHQGHVYDVKLGCAWKVVSHAFLDIEQEPTVHQAVKLVMPSLHYNSSIQGGIRRSSMLTAWLLIAG